MHGAELGLAVRRYSGFGTLRDGRKGEGIFPAEPIGRVFEIWIPRTPVAVFVASSPFLLRIIPLFKSISPSNRHGWDLVVSGERRQEDGSAVRVEGGSALAAVGRSGIRPMSNPVAEVAAAKSHDPHPEYDISEKCSARGVIPWRGHRTERGHDNGNGPDDGREDCICRSVILGQYPAMRQKAHKGDREGEVRGESDDRPWMLLRGGPDVWNRMACRSCRRMCCGGKDRAKA